MERAAGVVAVGVLAVAEVCAGVGVLHVVGVLVGDGFLGERVGRSLIIDQMVNSL